VQAGLTLERSFLDGLVIFLAVAELRGFRPAARRLGVTPSAVSQAIRALESRVGAPLFLRTTRSVALSEAGEQLLMHARPALEMLATGLNAASHLGDAVSGRLRINLPRASLPLFANRILPDFLELHPKLELEMVGEDDVIDIVAQGFDAGVRFGDVVHADMVAVWLTRPERLVVVGSPSFFCKYGTPNKPADLGSFRCILFRRPATIVRQWHFVLNGQRTPVQVNGPLITNDVEACIRAALRGVGLFCVPESLVMNYVAENKLATALDPFVDQVPGLTLYYPSRTQSLPKLRAFRAFAVERMRRQLLPGDYQPSWAF
jgi:DNA-binding transcriptional LysR family regulator